MCGIVGFLAKSSSLQSSLGELVTPMLDCMGTRGSDSAGLAVFTEPVDEGCRRFSLYCSQPRYCWQSFWDNFCRDTSQNGEFRAVANHAEAVSLIEPERFKVWLSDFHPHVHLLSVGTTIKVFKDEGHPREIARQYAFDNLTGTHAVGHTRMATESMVSPAHAHPFTAGEDFCLVHNGSLSNPHSVRRKLERLHIEFNTDNDTEAGCRFLQWRVQEGDTLEEAISASFTVLDGFFTFLMATSDKLVLVRDAFACKPAVVAETDDYVAVGSEFRSLAQLPGVMDADVFEPAPEIIYSWNV